MKSVRVRFAPSPTGALHIGGVRTALYNYLIAKKYHGKLILRIEDTDQSRYVEGAEEYILESLGWLGITFDEGILQGGPFGPYRQSDRKSIYQSHIEKLLADGNAYYAFDTSEELEQMRIRLKNEGSSFLQYDSHTRLKMKNSLTLPEAEVKEMIASDVPYVIRLNVPEDGEVVFHDIIRDQVVVQCAQIDDKVLMKSDGMPTYHLANVVDDHLMEISHVIRGEEWLPSAPLHVLLYRYFGWENDMPEFAHLPLLLKPDGNGKLSKRAADQMGFPIFPLNWKDPNTGELATGYKETGYLPEALLNFLALLGWNPGTPQELFSLDELITEFSLTRIGKGGAKFDIQKAKWFNQQYLQHKDDSELATILLEILQKEHIPCSPEKASKICEAMKERIVFPHEIWTDGKFFFEPPTQFDEKVISKKWNEETETVLSAFKKELSHHSDITDKQAQSHFENITTTLGISGGKVMQPLRVALTGIASGPDLMKTIEILGVEESVKRLDTALTKFKIKTI